MSQQKQVIVSEVEFAGTVAEGYARGRDHVSPDSWLPALTGRNPIPPQRSGDYQSARIIEVLCHSAYLGCGEFDVTAALSAMQNVIHDLQNVAAALCALRDNVAVPPHRQLSWRPGFGGVGTHIILVDGEPSKGFIRKHADITRGDCYEVVQLRFDCVTVESLEEGYDLLLRREFAARQVARVEQALLEHHELCRAMAFPADYAVANSATAGPMEQPA